MPRPPFSISSIDHIVLTVRSIPATIDFYTKILGMKAETFTPASTPNQVRHALNFGPHKINLHQVGAEFKPNAAQAVPGSADLCFLTETPVQDALASVKAAGIEVLEKGEIVSRTGARGRLRSFYIRDPDGNLVEISNYAES
ncbi:glyoxalase domain-containing protein 5 [Xylogone sp. PMI_703]|nr:glyoxalase domain-containing protein 5 [Xylogone sp. PMI_703]